MVTGCAEVGLAGLGLGPASGLRRRGVLRLGAAFFAALGEGRRFGVALLFL